MNDSEAAFRIPVLYEHNNPIKFIPFGKVPNDLMFEAITTKYASIIAAGYGLSLGDVGLNPNGGTLAGEIRGDMRSQKNGKARIKSKIKYFFDQILPRTLQFNFVDYDSELNVAMGRARLASATAFRTFVDLGIFSPQELRTQAIQDGLVSVTLPDAVPPESEFPAPAPVLGAFGKPATPAPAGKKKKAQAESDIVGNPTPASKGGEGAYNTRKSLTVDKSRQALNRLVENVPTIYEYLSTFGEDDYNVAKSDMQMSSGALMSHLMGIADTIGIGSAEKESIYCLLTDALGEILTQIDKSIVDNAGILPYDSMVDNLLRTYDGSNKLETEIT